ATQPIFYHSEASLPYFHRSTKTVFQLIKDDNATNTFQFGVIAAKDNDTLSYVVLAPSKKEGQLVNDLTDVNLKYAIPLLPFQVKEFIKILNSSAEKWNTKYDTKDGIIYEFMVSPENRIIPQSENVVVWYSTFKFYFQNNDDGPLGSVLFGEGLLRYYYRIEKLSEIKDLASMLSLAIKE
ncbi:MAG: hypothetical protein ACUVRG_11610, partial [Ignavibacterium sp.]|uniref:hypothetical protein n=1 Tax=Ignavibacterium sp. TaxID=2651167 RepID=UPI004049C4C7